MPFWKGSVWRNLKPTSEFQIKVIILPLAFQGTPGHARENGYTTGEAALTSASTLFSYFLKFPMNSPASFFALAS